MKSSINGLSRYYHSIKTFKVEEALFEQRCKRCSMRGALSDERIKHNATLSAAEYKKMYTSRRSILFINEELIDLGHAFDKIESPVVNYDVFRCRLSTYAKKQESMSLKSHTDVFIKAGLLTEEHWKYFIGGGCAKPFIYDGFIYPAIKGRQFLSVPSFLMEIGKLHFKPLVLSRLKQGFTLDRAISEEEYTPKDGYGRIYKLYSSECNQVYIGLTTLTLDERFNQHKNSARKGSGSLLHKTMRRYGIETFSICLIENHVPVSEVAEREIYNIKFFNTLSPHGLNKSAGGQLGSGRGKLTTVNGNDYKSITAAGKAIEKETKGAVRWYSVESCIRSGKKIPKLARKHSIHVDAGTNLFRRHLCLVRRKKLCHRWLSYDLFKLDVLKKITMVEIIDQKLRLGKIIGTKPYGPKNFSWSTPK